MQETAIPRKPGKRGLKWKAIFTGILAGCVIYAILSVILHTAINEETTNLPVGITVFMILIVASSFICGVITGVVAGFRGALHGFISGCFMLVVPFIHIVISA